MFNNDQLGDKRVPLKSIRHRTGYGVPLQTDLEALMNMVFRHITCPEDGSSEDIQLEQNGYYPLL
jgi:hypothetical protein